MKIKLTLVLARRKRHPRGNDAGREMPFKKIARGRNRGKYRSPSGRVWTAKQVRFYYASGGTMRRRKRKRR